MDEIPASDSPPDLPGGTRVKRHRLSTRLWHWVNVITLCVMMMSGLMILNAHPRLYWGKFGANPDHAWLVLAHGDALAFPGWITIPSHYSLADARIWHFAFAWVLALGLAAYLLRSLINGHVRRDLHITRAEWSPAHLWHDVKEHAALRFPTGEAALRYNALQKLAYCGVLFALLPLVIFTGLAMSPALNAAMPFLPDLFGGRQSARSLHFLAMCGLIAFFAVHIAMVLLAGPVNEVRSMITGWYKLPVGKKGRTDV